MQNPRNAVALIVLVLLVFLSSCAKLPQKTLEDTAVAYSIHDDGNLLSRFAPVFVIEDADREHNRIGTATAGMAAGAEHVAIDPDKATYYTDIRRFTTAKDNYTNLIYRIHFKEIPFGIVPFYLGAGDNIGLLTVVTLNSSNKPVLYSLLHTCGCYLAFIPTSYLPLKSLPAGRRDGRQDVYGENLPSLLEFSREDEDELLMVHIRPETHRVGDVFLATNKEVQNFMVVRPEIRPLEALEKLALGNGKYTSFYETSGPRKDYVKGSQKIWERLLISWWALDWRVGEDKRLGRDTSDGIVFYTSLKPWAREISDLRDFPGFLRYWGWDL